MATGTENWSEFTLPTAPITLNSITLASEEYGPSDVVYSVPAPLSLTISLVPPINALKYDNPSSLALVLALNAPTVITSKTNAPSTLELTLTLNQPTIRIRQTQTTLELTATLNAPSPTVVPTVSTLTLTGTANGPSLPIYSTPSCLAGLLTLNAPNVLITKPVSTVNLISVVNNGIPTPTATPATLALTSTIYPVLPIASEEGAVVNLTLTLNQPTPVITQHKGAVPGGELEMTISVGFAPTIGNIAPTIVRHIYDPVVSGGCPQCGSLLYSKDSRIVPGTAVKRGRNFDIDRGLREDGYIRCGRCGFICHPSRNIRMPEGSQIGWGTNNIEIEAGE